ncbi:hypothetical protein C5167_042456 [Papaver somniferum]|uniref:Uncharacterized protein n=1 Tax=Papaver somniferum TaxID=3469 RepID=A0A4Y7L5H6_PAPSO|nr:hypothetical protein C5167_042456 [Papaver somniferum]
MRESRIAILLHANFASKKEADLVGSSFGKEGDSLVKKLFPVGLDMLMRTRALKFIFGNEKLYSIKFGKVWAVINRTIATPFASLVLLAGSNFDTICKSHCRFKTYQKTL